MSQARRIRLRRLPWGAIGLTAALVTAGLAYGILLPVWRHGLEPPPPSPFGHVDWPLLDEIRRRLLEAFTMTWLLVIGASIGSFLNVVIYRCPRGKTLLGHSMCPFCLTPIRARHNIPVFGWLLLRGRCYDCRLPIAPRYPLVEALVGAVFVLLAAGELLTGGANLPLREVNRLRGITWIIFHPQWDLIGLYVYHCTLLTVLLSWAYIWYDGQRVPASYAAWALAVALLAPAVAPDLHAVPGLPPGWVSPAVPRAFAALTTGVLGGLTGIGLAVLLFSMSSHRFAARAALQLSLIGSALGWQAVFSIGLLTGPCGLVIRLIGGRIAPRWSAHPAFALWLACLVHLLAWRSLEGLPFWPGYLSPWYAYPVALVAGAWMAARAKSEE